MKIHVSGKHIDLSTALKDYTTQALESLISKYMIHPLDCEIIFSKDAHVFHTEIAIHLGRHVFLRIHDQGETAYLSLDHGVAKLEKKIKKHKNRLEHHHKHRDVHLEKTHGFDYILAEEKPDQLDDNPPIIAETTTAIPTLSVSEAVMRMDLGELPVVVFKNHNGGRLNVVYRRRDGAIGWIDPTVL